MEGPNTATTFTWFNVFWTPPKGNTYFNLAHQYQAAKLNSLNGANVPANVATALQDAEEFFDEFTPTNWPKGKRKDMIEWAGLFGSYNEGTIGPGHCDEDNTSDLAIAD